MDSPCHVIKGLSSQPSRMKLVSDFISIQVLEICTFESKVLTHLELQTSFFKPFSLFKGTNLNFNQGDQFNVCCNLLLAEHYLFCRIFEPNIHTRLHLYKTKSINTIFIACAESKRKYENINPIKLCWLDRKSSPFQMQISSRGWALEYLILSYWEIPQIRINKWTYVPETCSFPLWKWSFLWLQSGTYVVIIRYVCVYE